MTMTAVIIKITHRVQPFCWFWFWVTSSDAGSIIIGHWTRYHGITALWANCPCLECLAESQNEVRTAGQRCNFLSIHLAHQLGSCADQIIAKTKLASVVLTPAEQKSLRRQSDTEVFSNRNWYHLALYSFDTMRYQKFSEMTWTPKEQITVFLRYRATERAGRDVAHRHVRDLFNKLERMRLAARAVTYLTLTIITTSVHQSRHA